MGFGGAGGVLGLGACFGACFGACRGACFGFAPGGSGLTVGGLGLAPGGSGRAEGGSAFFVSVPADVGALDEVGSEGGGNAAAEGALLVELVVA